MSIKYNVGACFDDLNSFLEVLRQEKDLVEISEQMSPRFEIGAFLRELGEGPGHAALFKDVEGFPGCLIAGNLLGHRRRIALAFGVEKEEVASTYLTRKHHRVPPVLVNDGPLKEITVDSGSVDLLQILPALTHHEKDASPYLTCAVSFAKDPESGKQSMGMHRIQIQGGKALSVHLATPPLSRFLEGSWKLNKPLEVAIVIGPDPAVLMASVSRVPEGDDKIDIAGGFRQRPVEMIECETVALTVPAHAQYLVEGTIEPGDMVPEGVFGDSTGTYVKAESPLIRVTSVSHRKNPIYQALQPWSSEDDALLNLCFGSDLMDEVKRDYPFVLDIHMISGTVFAHLVVSVDKCSGPARRSAMVALLNGNPFVKRVIVVDGDINIRNPREVEWAMATRFQPDRDLLLLPEVQGSMIDPSAFPHGVTCKRGMDATFSKKRIDLFEKVSVPVESEKRAKGILNRAVRDFHT
jgi:2,5-furandicarboxylate decarboxylase 1